MKTGTKITYNRDMLLMLQQSPLSKSPINLTAFPGLSKGTNVSVMPVKSEIVRIVILPFRPVLAPGLITFFYYIFTSRTYLSYLPFSDPFPSPHTQTNTFSSIPLLHPSGSCCRYYFLRYAIFTTAPTLSRHIFSLRILHEPANDQTKFLYFSNIFFHFLQAIATCSQWKTTKFHGIEFQESIVGISRALWTAWQVTFHQDYYLTLFYLLLPSFV